MLADIFENFQSMPLEIYDIDPTKFLSAPGLAWKVALKKAKVKLDLSTGIDILFMVEKGIRGEISHPLFINMQKLITRKIIIKIL